MASSEQTITSVYANGQGQMLLPDIDRAICANDTESLKKIFKTAVYVPKLTFFGERALPYANENIRELVESTRIFATVCKVWEDNTEEHFLHWLPFEMVMWARGLSLDSAVGSADSAAAPVAANLRL
jgi:hypothetical protein